MRLTATRAREASLSLAPAASVPAASVPVVTPADEAILHIAGSQPRQTAALESLATAQQFSVNLKAREQRFSELKTISESPFLPKEMREKAAMQLAELAFTSMPVMQPPNPPPAPPAPQATPELDVSQSADPPSAVPLMSGKQEADGSDDDEQNAPSSAESSASDSDSESE